VPDGDFYDQPRFCSRCGLPVTVEGASFCKDCGAVLGASGIIGGEGAMRPLVAFLLSIIPGLGHIYQGHVGRGVIWFFSVAIAYGAGPIGYLLHLICAVSAASYGRNRYDDRRRRRRRRIDRISAQV
jgi:TM2 domain-containing membrane protein YozV